MNKPAREKNKKSISSKIEEVEAYVAFAEAGELYPHGKKKPKKKKGSKKEHVCVEGETSSGLCNE